MAFEITSKIFITNDWMGDKVALSIINVILDANIF